MGGVWGGMEEEAEVGVAKGRGGASRLLVPTLAVLAVLFGLAALLLGLAFAAFWLFQPAPCLSPDCIVTGSPTPPLSA